MEAIIFDYGGVLCFHPAEEQIAELAGLLGVAPATFLDAYWAFRVAYDRGDYTPQGYWAEIAKRLGKDYTAEQVETFRKKDIGFWLSMDQRMLKWIREMRVAGIKVGLISNLPMDLGEHLRAHTALFSLFDHVTLSYEQRCVKPDSPIYIECCKGLGIAPGECLFLDDKEPNVVGARTAGLHSLVFETPELLSSQLAGEAHHLLPFGAPPIDLG